MLSSAAFCHLWDEILTAVLRHQILLAALVDEKRADSCHLFPDFICLLAFLFFPSTCYKISQLMGAMLIEHIVTRVEAYSSDIPVAKNDALSWMPALQYVCGVLIIIKIICNNFGAA